MKLQCRWCGERWEGTWEQHKCEREPSLPRVHDSLENSEPPEPDTIHAFVGRMEYRADRREAKRWRESQDMHMQAQDERLQRIEKRLTVVGLVIAAATAATNGTVPWEKIAQALGW